MKFGIVVFPGSNCDRDCNHVLGRVLGQQTSYLWHGDRQLDDVDVVVLPGGFSYGDYLRTGALAKLSPVMEAVVDFAQQGGPVLGICNGFQVLLECGLLPGAMVRNNSLKFVCRDVDIRCTRPGTAFSEGLAPGEVLRMPVAHAEGNYIIDEDGLARLRDGEQIVFQYCRPDGEVAEQVNPNGSVANIAGICNRRGNVVGMMPHPERASEAVLGGTDGRLLFEAAISWAAG
jgi:phosphoribosylformylglycinamidine synthase